MTTLVWSASLHGASNFGKLSESTQALLGLAGYSMIDGSGYRRRPIDIKEVLRMKTKRSMVVLTGVVLAMVLVATAFAFAGKPQASQAGSTASMDAAQSLGVDVAATDDDADEQENEGVDEDADQEENEGADEDADEEDNEGADEDENLTAKITPDQAKSAALSVHPGTVTEVELENEDGKTVYSVCIDGDDGKKYDVKVDANSGQVLKSELDDEDDEGDEDSEADQDSEETDAD